jgi:hypothetical protein
LCVRLVGMSRPDEIHRNVGVDQNQEGIPRP